MVDKQTMQNITEASAAKWKRLHELEAENARLRAEVKRLVSANEHWHSRVRQMKDTAHEQEKTDEG